MLRLITTILRKRYLALLVVHISVLTMPHHQVKQRQKYHSTSSHVCRKNPKDLKIECKNNSYF